MKKLLPKTLNNPSGFTLVELLVIISIIAILAVVGFSVFNGAQAQARDGRRRSEIDALGKAIESSKNPGVTPNTYAYTVADFNADFPTNRPDDPTAARDYCIAVSAANPPVPPAVATTNAATGCPTGGAAMTIINTTATPTTGIPIAATTTAWTLCASLERGTAPFCVQSLGR